MIQNIGIEDSQGNRIVDQKKVLKIWEYYVTRTLPYLFDFAISLMTAVYYPKHVAGTV